MEGVRGLPQVHQDILEIQDQGHAPQGMSIIQVTTDFDGGLRPQRAAYDMGAYEYGSREASPPSPL